MENFKDSIILNIDASNEFDKVILEIKQKLWKII